MFNARTGGYNASKTFLSLALFVLVVNGANGFLSSDTVNYQRARNLSQGNLTRADPPQSDSVASFNATVKDGEARQGRLFFGTNSRTLFGARRRIQFALLPIMYKLGVISTMLVGLTVMVLKGLTIGVVLLFFALGNAFLKHKYHQSSQPVHFHLHPGDFHPKAPLYHGYEPSGPWDKTSDDGDVANYENYDPSNNRKINVVRHPYRYSHRDYYPYLGR